MNYFIKKHLFLLVFPLLTFFISCSKDDECEIGSANDLIGTWTVSNSSLEVLVNGTDFVQWLVNNQGLNEAEAQLAKSLFEANASAGFSGTITFNEDETYSTNLGGENETGIWTLSDSALTLDPDMASEGPKEFSITTLNSSTLVMVFSETESEDLDDDGTAETLSLNFNVSFSK